MGEAKEVRIHVVLKGGVVVTFLDNVAADVNGEVPDEARWQFGAVVEEFGRAAWRNELISGIDEHGDYVAIPGENVAYVRGAGI